MQQIEKLSIFEKEIQSLLEEIKLLKEEKETQELEIRHLKLSY